MPNWTTHVSIKNLHKEFLTENCLPTITRQAFKFLRLFLKNIIIKQSPNSLRVIKTSLIRIMQTPSLNESLIKNFKHN